MSEITGFNIEDMVNVTPLTGGGEAQEPKVEQLISKLRKLQQGKRALDEEIKDLKSVRDSLQKELETCEMQNVQNETYQLEGIHKEKEELCRKLHFQFEESEQDSTRQLKQNDKSEELLKQYRYEIQEFILKHRKQRMKFENQLLQLIEQHKKLHSVFTPEKLPEEIENAEQTKWQLLSAEQHKLAQVCCLDEQLEDMRKQMQLGTTPAKTQEE